MNTNVNNNYLDGGSGLQVVNTKKKTSVLKYFSLTILLVGISLLVLYFLSQKLLKKQSDDAVTFYLNPSGTVAPPSAVVEQRIKMLETSMSDYFNTETLNEKKWDVLASETDDKVEIRDGRLVFEKGSVAENGFALLSLKKPIESDFTVETDVTINNLNQGDNFSVVVHTWSAPWKVSVGFRFENNGGDLVAIVFSADETVEKVHSRKPVEMANVNTLKVSKSENMFDFYINGDKVIQLQKGFGETAVVSLLAETSDTIDNPMKVSIDEIMLNLH